MTPIRLTTPGDICAAVPHLCGFVPTESLVAISLLGERRRIGMTMRVDLPDDLRAAEELAVRLAADEGTSAVLVAYTDEPGGRPREALMAAVTDALEGRGIEVMEALLVRGGRWFSYSCDSQGCCPAEGTPLRDAVDELAARAAYDGRAVLPDREALVASLAPPSDDLTPGLEAALLAVVAGIRRRGRAAVRREAVAAFRAVLGEQPGDVAGLVASLQDVHVRDEVATLALESGEELLTLLLVLARQSAAPFDVPVCTLIALVAWVRGDGALANVALDRALANDPACSMALLLRAGLDGQLPPAAVRTWLRETRESLRGVA